MSILDQLKSIGHKVEQQSIEPIYIYLNGFRCMSCRKHHTFPASKLSTPVECCGQIYIRSIEGENEAPTTETRTIISI